jgi:multidrug efflux pump subunit AcrA (membrane-fusion protein)
MLGIFGRRRRVWPHAVLAIVAALLGWARLAGAHGEQLATGKGGGGPVTLTADQREAIGLETVAADFRDIDTVLPLNAFVAHDPNRHVFVSTRIDGKVESILVNVGDRVSRGQKLAVIQSRQIGEPPPTITVTSPIAGVVDDRLVAPGEAIEPNKALFHIADLSQVIVVADAYEEDVRKIALGQDVRVHALAYPGEPFTGTVSFLGQQLDPEKRTLPVWITVANPDSRLKPGMSAKAVLVLKRSGGVLSVPAEALVDAGGERFVFVDGGGKLTRVDVRTGAADDRFVEILDGLVPGDLVVTQGTREVYATWLTGGAVPAHEPD